MPGRAAMLAWTAALGIAMLAGVPAYVPSALAAVGKAIEPPASQTQAPAAGFADPAAKVKPAVFSVRVRFNGVANAAGATNDQTIPFGENFRDFFGQFDFGNQFGFGKIPNLSPQLEQRVAAGGSGFFISADGYAVTNNHVINNAKSVQVITDESRTLDAKVVGTDPKTDLALLKVEGDNFPYVKFADHNPRIRDWVIAVGNPFGLGGTVTAVSASGARHRRRSL